MKDRRLLNRIIKLFNIVLGLGVGAAAGLISPVMKNIRNLTPAQRTDIVIAFCDTIAEAGYTPMIYGNIRMLCGDLEPERIAKYEKWLAQYFNRPTYRYDFGVWQYSSTAHVNGIDGNVDINIAFRDYGKQD